MKGKSQKWFKPTQTCKICKERLASVKISLSLVSESFEKCIKGGVYE